MPKDAICSMRLARRFALYDPVDEADATCAVQAGLVEKLGACPRMVQAGVLAVVRLGSGA
jgi:hypothetical protein